MKGEGRWSGAISEAESERPVVNVFGVEAGSEIEDLLCESADGAVLLESRCVLGDCRTYPLCRVSAGGVRVDPHLFGLCGLESFVCAYLDHRKIASSCDVYDGRPRRLHQALVYQDSLTAFLG